MSSIISPPTFTPLPITILFASLLEDANPTFTSKSQIFISSLFSKLNLYHKAKIAVAEERYKQVAKGGIPEDIKEFNIENNDEINICDLLVKVGFASSKSEAKRMVIGRGVKVGGEIIEDISTTLKPKEKILQFGKNKFIKII